MLLLRALYRTRELFSIMPCSRISLGYSSRWQVTFSRWRCWHQLLKAFIHCFVERDVFLFTATALSSCIASLETAGNLETSTSCVSSGFAFVWLLLVSFLLDWGAHGSWADVEEKSPKYSSNRHWKLETPLTSSAWKRSLSSFRNVSQ